MNKQRILKALSDFIAIQSVSADSKRFSEIKEAVSFLKSKLADLGCNVHISKSGAKPPIIIGTKKVPRAGKTLGIYGHYDVQSEDPISEWKNEPYKLTIKNGKLYGRGVADNKGHVIQNLTAIEELILSKELKHNIIFLFEGEEETGSEEFEKLMKKYRNTLSKAVVYFVTDVGMLAKHKPQILYGLRGLVYFEIEVSIGNTDLHSGVYGNSVFNPANVLADLFSKMKDVKTGEILIPGLYDGLRKVPKEEIRLLMKSGETDKDLQKETGTHEVTSFRNIPAYIAPKIFPSLDIHGIITGYTGEGPKTVIPRKATAKFSCRLVERQQPQKIEKLVMKFIKDTLPSGVKHTVKILSRDFPFYSSINNEYIEKTAEILSKHFKNDTVFSRSGGSVPAAEILQRLFEKPIILTGFTLPDDNIHAPNENFDEEMFFAGIEALKKIYSQL